MYRNITFFFVMLFMACTSAQAASQVYQISEGAANNANPHLGNGFSQSGIAYINTDKAAQATSIKFYNFSQGGVIKDIVKKPFSEGKLAIAPVDQAENSLTYSVESLNKKQLCLTAVDTSSSCTDIASDVLDYIPYHHNRGAGLITKQNDGLYFSIIPLTYVDRFSTKINSSLTGSLKIVGISSGNLLIAYTEPTGKLSQSSLQKIYRIGSYLWGQPASILDEQVVKGIVNPTTFASNQFLNVVAIETTPNLAKADERELYVCDSSVADKCEFKKVASYESKLKGSIKVSNKRIAYLSNSGVTVIDTAGKVLSTIKLPIDAFDYLQGEVVYQSKGHIYYQDLDYSKSRNLGIRVAEIEKRLQSVK